MTKKILIGRDDSNNVVIAENSVSRVHAELIDNGKKLFLKDLESKNATYIVRDGIHLIVGPDPVELKQSDQLRFGLVGPYTLSNVLPAFQAKVTLIAPSRELGPEPELKTSTAVVKPKRYRCPSCGSIVKDTFKQCDHCHTHL
jgi:pSer/pThr/pTyr-binding forkhead associated (FHA) protein